MTDTTQSMLPVIALLGRPNVGKSTLFNFLTRTRDALVADMPGLTRDRKYGFGRVGRADYVVIDTGGLSVITDGVEALMAAQSRRALEEADAAVFVVDGREGLTAADEELAVELRRAGKPVFLAVNKTEGMNADMVSAEFHALGLGTPYAISSAHGRGVEHLINTVLDALPERTEQTVPATTGGIHVAVIGRPNVGKSTLINRMLGEDRLVAFDRPGTTRDTVFVPFERDGHSYVMIDTAGVRRRSRVHEAVEKFSVVKTLQAIDRADVVIGVLDAHEGVSEQDAGLLGLAMERGRAVVIAVNKWDGLAPDARDRVRALLEIKLPFLSFAPVHFISALHGSGVGDLFGSIREAWRAACAELSTSELTRVLQEAVSQHQPPLVRGRRIKLRYAHQGGKRPPVIVIHGNQTESVPEDYRRYLVNTFRRAFGLEGTPVRVEFRSGSNPFAGRRNKLTPRQLHKKKRLERFVKRRK